MFIISQSDSYSWPVSVDVPTDGGKQSKQTFDGTFKRLPQSRVLDIRTQAGADQVNDVDIAREVLIGWAGITDAQGDDVPFSEGMRDRLLDVTGVASAIVRAWMESITGGKRKN